MYRIGLARFDSSVAAVVFDLPGCSAEAPDADVALAMAPIVIAERLAWERRMGLDQERSVEISIDVIEDGVAAGTGAADGEFCFDDDLRALTDDELGQAVGLFECSRRDLLGATRDLPDATLDWRPPPSAMARIDPWNPGVRTIREIIAEIASAEAYYRTALREGAAPPDDSPDELCDPALQRRRLIDALGALPVEDRRRVFMPVRSWQTAPEHWTARKVVRRVIAHERFHTAEIRQRLTWILLGVPDFGL